MGQTAPRRRVAIVAEEARLRDELAGISQAAGHQVVSARASAPSTERSHTTCDVAILADGFQRGLTELTLVWPQTPIILVLSDTGSRTVSAALREGATGIVSRNDLATTLPVTILAVLCGQLCIPREYARQAERPELSMREKQILGMVVLGFANIEIAQRLFVAESTVKSHLNSAFRKLGVRSRGEATTLILNPTTGLGTGILTIPTSQPETERSKS